jgi:hypothetical protein
MQIMQTRSKRIRYSMISYTISAMLNVHFYLRMIPENSWSAGTGRVKNQGMVFRIRSRTTSAPARATTSNPGDRVFAGSAVSPDAGVAGTVVISTGSGVRPVENEFSAPAVTETGAERSWYPLSFRSTVWLPAARPGMVVGETPRWTPSI